MGYFILIKRKGSKHWKGTIPAKNGTSKRQLEKTVSKNIKKGLTFKVIDKKQLIGLLKRLKPRRVTKKRSRVKKK